MTQQYNATEIRQVLKQVLQGIKGRGPFKRLNEQIKGLFANLKAEKRQTGVKMYHSSRFSFLKEGSYYTTNRGKSIKINKQTLQKLYEQIKKVFLQIEIILNKGQIDQNLDYAIYFKGSDGKIKRASMKSIPKQQLRKTSKGALKTTKLQTYLKSVEQEEENDIAIIDVHTHLDSFIGVVQATYTGKEPIPNRTLSYGRLAEAFEMHLQSNLTNHDFQDTPPWNYNEIWSFIRQSTGNVPWYLTGDVGGTQVKYIGKGDVRLSSQSTFQDILNFFNYILNNEIDEEMLNNTYNIFIGQLENASQNQIKEFAHMDIQTAVNKLGLKLIKQV